MSPGQDINTTEAWSYSTEHPNLPKARSVGRWAEKQRAPGSRPSADNTWKVFWSEGKVPEPLQRTAAVLLSKAPIHSCSYRAVRFVQGWTRLRSLCTLPVTPKGINGSRRRGEVLGSTEWSHRRTQVFPFLQGLFKRLKRKASSTNLPSSRDESEVCCERCTR